MYNLPSLKNNNNMSETLSARLYMILTIYILKWYNTFRNDAFWVIQ